MDKLAELSHGAKVVLGATIAFLIVSIFNWQEISLGEFGDAGVSMWHGTGVIAGLLAIVIVVWQAIRLANINIEVGVTPSMITAALALLLVIFTVIKFLVDGEFRTFWAWIGLALAIVVAVGAWMNMQAAGESFTDVRDRVSSMTASSSASGGTVEAAPPAPEPAPPAAPPEATGDDEPRSA
jgi:cation transport ATPase